MRKKLGKEERKGKERESFIIICPECMLFQGSRVTLVNC